MAVEALLDRYLLEQCVDVDGHLLFHHAVDTHRPGPDLERLRLFLDVLLAAEFVIIVVNDGELFLRQVAVQRVFRIALRGIERGRGIFLGAGSGSPRAAGQTHASAGGKQRAQAHRLHQTAALAENVLVGCRGLRQLPALFRLDQHGTSP